MAVCINYKARHWEYKRSKSTGHYSTCCSHGKVQLPPLSGPIPNIEIYLKGRIPKRLHSARMPGLFRYLDGYRSIAVSGSSMRLPLDASALWAHLDKAENIRYIIHNIQEWIPRLANADAIRERELASARHHLTRIRWTAVDRVYLRGSAWYSETHMDWMLESVLASAPSSLRFVALPAWFLSDAIRLNRRGARIEHFDNVKFDELHHLGLASLSDLRRLIERDNDIICFVPICQKEHWYLVRIDAKQQAWSLASSMPSLPQASDLVTGVLDLIAYLGIALKHKGFQVLPIAVQGDSHSCGSACISVVEEDLLRLEPFDPRHSKMLRLRQFDRIAQQILQEADEDDDGDIEMYSLDVLESYQDSASDLDDKDVIMSHSIDSTADQFPPLPSLRASTSSSRSPPTSPSAPPSTPPSNAAAVVAARNLRADWSSVFGNTANTAFDAALPRRPLRAQPSIPLPPTVASAPVAKLRGDWSRLFGTPTMPVVVRPPKHPVDESEMREKRGSRSKARTQSAMDDAAKALELQEKLTRYTREIEEACPGSKVSSTDLRVVICGACRKHIRVKGSFQPSRFRDHLKGASCRTNRLNPRITGLLPKVSDFLTWAKTPDTITPCPGLTTPTCLDYLTRTSAPGGGASRRRDLIIQVYPAKKVEKNILLDKDERTQVNLHERDILEWRNDHVLQCVKSRTCLGAAGYSPTSGLRANSCKECLKVAGSCLFTPVLRYKAAPTETQRFTNNRFCAGDTLVTSIYRRCNGLEELFNSHDKPSLFLRFAQKMASGQLQGHAVMDGMIRAAVTKSERTDAGKTMRGFVRTQALVNFEQAIAMASPAALRVLQTSIGVSSNRKLHEISAGAAIFNLHVDDTCLRPRIRTTPIYDNFTSEERHTVIGVEGGSITYSTQEELQAIFNSDDPPIAGTKVRTYMIASDAVGSTAKLLAALVIGEKTDTTAAAEELGGLLELLVNFGVAHLLVSISADDEATSTVGQGVPPNVDEAGLNQVLDCLRLVGSEPLPCILRREERDAILSALLSVTALDIDPEALIDAVDAGFDQADAEEEDRQLQTILAEACHEHEQSWEAPPYPRHLLEKGALYSVPTLDLDSLLARRRAHQCRHLEKIKFKGGAQNVASDQPFAQDRTEHRGNEPSLQQFRANIREKTLHEQATTAIITEGRSHVYGQIMSNHVLVRAVDGDVSALRPLQVDTLVVYGIPEEPMGLPSGEQCGERLAIGIGMPNYYLLEDIYKKSSTTYESVESFDSLALVANAVIQELRVIAPGVYSNLINYEVKDSTRSNWRDEREIHITVNQEKRYTLLQNIKGIRAASLACLAPGGRSQTKTKGALKDPACFGYLDAFTIARRTLGALIPAVNQRPIFAKTWLICPAEATDTQLGPDGADSRIQRSTLTKLDSTLRTGNRFVRGFALVNARAGWDTAKEWILRLCIPLGQGRPTHNLPTSSTEMAMLICDSDTNTGDRGPQELIVQVRSHRCPDGRPKYQVVSSLHPSAMPLQYPTLFAAEENSSHLNTPLCGFHQAGPPIARNREQIDNGVQLREVLPVSVWMTNEEDKDRDDEDEDREEGDEEDGDGERQRPRRRGRGGSTRVSRSQFFAYYLHEGDEYFSIPHAAQRVFLGFLIDGYSQLQVETDRPNYIRFHQETLRLTTAQGITDAVANGLTPDQIRRSVILGLTFKNSPRENTQRYQDAMTCVVKYGKPLLFITVTCNPEWSEIRATLGSNDQACNRPDLIARLFEAKLHRLCDNVFGNTSGNPLN
ncbi:BQ5605_C004g02670 [Microbotryum silenes-dioicae]|uniref:BQ5605_C004g02670 protein n=1 Tax=Microbotryum silenes-dioicae TaxID=796604 RepID=A0A2X0M8E4_9BASI|nr:BQ5605_C004g02670 [Microbotryum silenes-dioicae]